MNRRIHPTYEVSATAIVPCPQHRANTIEQFLAVDLVVVDEGMAVAVGSHNSRPLADEVANLRPGAALPVH